MLIKIYSSAVDYTNTPFDYQNLHNSLQLKGIKRNQYRTKLSLSNHPLGRLVGFGQLFSVQSLQSEPNFCVFNWF